MYLGSFGIDDYVGIPAATHRFTTGAAYAPTVLTYSIYEEGGTTGIDEDVDMVPGTPFDAIVGCYWIRRQLTAAAGFELGKNYMVAVKATVDSVAAIQMHTFQMAASVDVDTIKTQAITCAAAVTILASVGASAAPGASGGLPTTNGTKLNQTVDLTSGQSIAASSVPTVTLANGAHGGAGTTIVLQTPIEANVASETNHDFTALQKTALNAATPASVQNIPATGSGFTALGDTRLANLDAAISTRSTYAGGAVASVSGAVGSVTGDVEGKVLGGGVGTITGTGAQATVAGDFSGTMKTSLLTGVVNRLFALLGR